MELSKLKQEKEAFEQHLRDVIQSEIDGFVKANGVHPADIRVDIIRVDQVGQRAPDYILQNVEVSFGL